MSISAPQITSTIAEGTAPLVVTSTTVVTNLNADKLDGNDSSYFEPAITAGTSSQYYRGDKTMQTLNLDALDDVAIATPIIDQVLKYTGSSWVNGPQSSSSAGSAVELFLDDTSLISPGPENSLGVHSLTKFPVTTTEVVDSVVVNNNTVACEAYLLNAALGRTQIDGGIWLPNTYAAVDNSAGVSEIIISGYTPLDETGITLTITGSGTTRTATASGGTPFQSSDANADVSLASYIQTPKGLYQISAYTSGTVVTIVVPAAYVNESAVAFFNWRYRFQMSTGEINNIYPTISLYDAARYAKPAYPITINDKLGFIYFGKTTGTSNTTVYFTHNGSTRYSSITTPLITLHDDLAGLQPAGTGITWGHVNNGSQAIYGAKSFTLDAANADLTPIEALAPNLTNGNRVYIKAGISDLSNYSALVYHKESTAATSYTKVLNFQSGAGLLVYDDGHIDLTTNGAINTTVDVNLSVGGTGAIKHNYSTTGNALRYFNNPQTGATYTIDLFTTTRYATSGSTRTNAAWQMGLYQAAVAGDKADYFHLSRYNVVNSFDFQWFRDGSFAFNQPVAISQQMSSTLATGTSPFSITSTTLNTNLNADLLDDEHASAFVHLAGTETITGVKSFNDAAKFLDSISSCYATYSTSINLTKGGGTLTGTAVGTAGINGGYLDLASNDISYVDYSGTNNVSGLVQEGEIKLIINPSGTSLPGDETAVLAISSAAGSTINLIELRFKYGEYFYCRICDSAGADIVNGAIGASLSGETDVEVCLTFNVTTGNVVMRVNGATTGTLTGTGTRSNNIGLLRVGGNYNASLNSNLYIKNIVFFPTVQTTADYAKGYILNSYGYNTLKQNPYGLNLAESNLLISTNTIKATNTNGSLNLLTSGDGHVVCENTTANFSYVDIKNNQTALAYSQFQFISGRYNGTSTRTDAIWSFGLFQDSSAGESDCVFIGRAGITHEDFTVNRRGAVGIGRIDADAGYMFQIKNDANYKAKAPAWDLYSCARKYKTDIVRLNPNLDALFDVSEGTKFKYNYPKGHKFENLNGVLGTVMPADDLDKIEQLMSLPRGSLVSKDAAGEYMSINETNLIPTMWEMMRAIHGNHKSLNERVKKLEKPID